MSSLWQQLHRRIGAAAYDGNRVASTGLVAQHRSRQIWHVLFGHVGDLAADLPQLHRTQFLIRYNRDAAVMVYYMRCPCGIIERRFQTRLV